MRPSLDLMPAGTPHDAAIRHKRAMGGAPIKERLTCL
jgi:hypothetical protein